LSGQFLQLLSGQKNAIPSLLDSRNYSLRLVATKKSSSALKNTTLRELFLVSAALADAILTKNYYTFILLSSL
jgi:hypothetical protein